MAYESQLERFETVGREGERHEVAFLRAGFLAMGDQPELYFFRMDAADTNTADREIVVAISGSSLKRFQHGRRALSREAKIDLTALLLKKRMEAGVPLESQNLFLRDEELAQLAAELRIPL